MAGWRMAFAVGNERIIQAVNEFQDHVFVGMFGGLQQAASAALSGDPEHTESLKRIYKERIDFFTALCEKELGWKMEKPKEPFTYGLKFRIRLRHLTNFPITCWSMPMS